MGCREKSISEGASALLKTHVVCSLLPLWVSRIKRGAPEKRTSGDGVFRASNFSPFSLSVEENGYDEYENELGITAIALYDYQAGKQVLVFNLTLENSVLRR